MDYAALWARECAAEEQRFVVPGVIWHFTRVPGGGYEAQARLARDFFALQPHEDFLTDHAVMDAALRLAH